MKYKDKLRLMTIVGTRPEIIKMSAIIKKGEIYFENILVHTGQNYDARLNDIFYDDLNLRRPDYYLDVVGDNLGETLGNIIQKSYEIMQKVKPDALLILGDTNSALSSIAAKRLKIPIFHMEAGNRCFDENLPEETNRRIVDHISDVNLPYTEHARRYLLAEGVCKQHIYVTGSPMKEVINAHQEEIDKSDVLSRLGLEKKKYIILSAHREENIDILQNFEKLVNSINQLAETYNIPVIYSMHPRSEKYIKERNVIFHNFVRPMPPFCFTEYSALMKNAFCVVSDSGTMPEEAAIGHFPAVCIRTSTERPEALDKGDFVIGGIGENEVLQAVDMVTKMAGAGDFGAKVPDYEVDNVSSVVVRVIQSYTKIINETVWRK